VTFDPLAVMLEARSVALVGASPRAGSLGARMIEEVAKSASRPRTYLVNPRYEEISGARCYPGLADLPSRPDLALLAVPDGALEEQVKAVAAGGARSAVIFGSAVDPAAESRNGVLRDSGPVLRDRIASLAADAGLPVCGAGCMGFVNVARGLRAVGYTEPDPLPAGPVALVTHSGSVFSALLRTRRGFGFTLAVSSGQELVTPAAAYARYALSLPSTRVLALVLETIRDAPALRSVLADAAARDIPVLLLTAGTSAVSRSLVAAHSGALAAGDGAWQALASAYGVHRVGDLAELADTLELFSLSLSRRRGGTGIATVHDSGFERAHVADVAAAVGVPFAPLASATRERLAAILDPGLEPGNPLDVWGTGRDTETLFTETLSALADDPGTGAVALAVDLVPEYDGDDSYRAALLAAAAKTAKPVCVLASIPAAIDVAAADRLRAAGIPVLESTRTGLLALRHLLDHGHLLASAPPAASAAAPELSARCRRWATRLAAGPLSGADLFDLLRDYGIPAVQARSAASAQEARAAALRLGYPVAVKTDAPGIAHKSDVGGVWLGVTGPAELDAAYADLSARLGPRVTVTEMSAPGAELILGMSRDPALGPLIVLGAGGVLAEYLAETAVALPPLTAPAAADLIGAQRFARLLHGYRGQPPADLPTVAAGVAAFSVLITDLGDHLEAFDINPLICGASGAIAVDALAVPVANSRTRLSSQGRDWRSTGQRTPQCHQLFRPRTVAPTM
jgi:acyl-CoA synthetase (NDP forming)